MRKIDCTKIIDRVFREAGFKHTVSISFPDREGVWGWGISDRDPAHQKEGMMANVSLLITKQERQFAVSWRELVEAKAKVAAETLKGFLDAELGRAA